MSGTSLDGLDLALCECHENTLKVLYFKTEAYSQELRQRLEAIQSKEQIHTVELCVLHTELAHIHAHWMLEALEEWRVSPKEVHLIASHGQTVYHAPTTSPRSTLQIVDGDHIAQKTGIITISDFRQKHTAVGGQGAPLVALMDEHLFRHPTRHRMLLNLGGIGNFTWLPSRQSGQKVLCSDTGPANTLINQAMQTFYGTPFDEDGRIAEAGKVHSGLVHHLMQLPFFRKPFPKTTGQEEFNLTLVEEVAHKNNITLSAEDWVATLTQFTVYSILRAFDDVLPNTNFDLYVSGGGVYNPVIMKGLQNLPNATLHPFEELGLPADAKEAALMAFLANTLVLGHTFEVNGNPITLGKISLPG